MPAWNKPHPHDTEHPAQTIAGALAVFAFGFGSLVAAYWFARLVQMLWISGGPVRGFGLFIALTAIAAVIGCYSCWAGVRWFWVGVGAWTRRERVDDDDPTTSPDNHAD